MPEGAPVIADLSSTSVPTIISAAVAKGETLDIKIRGEEIISAVKSSRVKNIVFLLLIRLELNIDLKGILKLITHLHFAYVIRL